MAAVPVAVAPTPLHHRMAHVMLPCLLLLASLIPTTRGHYLWLLPDAVDWSNLPAAKRSVGVVLAEEAVGQSSIDIMSSLQSKCQLAVTDAEERGREVLPLAVQPREGNGGAELRSAQFRATTPLTAEVECVYGLFGDASDAGGTGGVSVPPPLLTYYAAAQLSPNPHADAAVLKMQLHLDFGVTAYHHAVAESLGLVNTQLVRALSDPQRQAGADRCSIFDSGADGPCVMFAVWWRGQLLQSEPADLWVYSDAGEPTHTLHLPASAGGVVALPMPAAGPTPMFARAYFQEDVRGIYQGDSFSSKMHYATRTFTLPTMPMMGMAAQLVKATAASAWSPLEWQDCGLQTDLHLLHLEAYAHTPDRELNYHFTSLAAFRCSRNTAVAFPAYLNKN